MAYIPEYEHDIFISYSHVDNAAFPGQTDGWIEQFYKNLNLMLAKRAGRMDMVKIWWDNKKLDGSVLFDDSIADGIKKSAIMICLYSPGYKESKYCKLELDTFYNKAKLEKAGLKVGERSRILNVLLNNIPFEEWPEELGGTSGFSFNDGKEKGDYGDPLESMSPEFRNQMQNIRDAIWQLITDFAKVQAEVPKQPDTVKETGDDKFTIYLGEVADTLRTPRKRILAELEKKGYRVVTGLPPPDEAEAHEKATKKALESSNLAINLLDQYPGKEITGTTEMWYPQRQTEIALTSNKAQMIWVPSETDFETVEDEKYKIFLKGLESGKAANKEFDYIRGSKSTVAQEIIDLAEQIKARQSSQKSEKGKISVLLDTHFNDQMYALDLSRTLIENEIQPFINPQEDDPRKNINLLGDRISQVQKLIFLYGSVSKEWVLERMNAALQLIITNNYPIDDFFIFMAPPHKMAGDITMKQRFLRVNIIDGSNSTSIDKNGLSKFLNDLKTSAI